MSAYEFEAFLTDTYGTITIAGLEFEAGAILRMMDPIAFDVFKADMERDSEEEME